MDNGIFMVTAKAFAAKCSADKRDDGIARALKAFDSSLDLLWHNPERQFYVVVRLRPGEGPRADGHPYPLFPVGADPRVDDVLAEVRKRDLRGRARLRGQEQEAEVLREKAAADKRAAENLWPNMPEYALRVLQCDDNWHANMLMRDMAKEVRRAS